MGLGYGDRRAIERTWTMGHYKGLAEHWSDVAPPAYVTLGAVHLKKKPRGKRETVRLDAAGAAQLLADFKGAGGRLQ